MDVSTGRLASVRRGMLSSAVFLVLGLAGGCAPDAPSGPIPAGDDASLAVTGGGTEIRTRLDASKCLTARNGIIASGTRTELQPCDGRASQQFTLLADGAIGIGDNFCLDASGDRGQNGDPIIVWTCNGGRNQRWRFTDASEIRGVGNMCVDVSGGVASDGESVILWKCHGETNQKWDLRTTSSSDPAPVASVSVTLAADALAVGDTTRASATLRDAAGTVLTGRTVSWSSSAPAIASVTAAGLVTALAAGSAQIVATSEGQSAGAVLTVIASEPAPPASCGLVTDLASRGTSALAKPGYLRAARDPEFGTTITRITGDPGTPIPGVGGTWGTVAGHHYSKDAAWSADQQLLLLTRGVANPQGNLLFLDGTTYQPLFGRSAPGPEVRWHPRLAGTMVYVTSGGAFGHWDVRADARAVKVAPAGYRDAVFGPNEGNLSLDGRWAVAVATRSADGRRVAYAVDIDGGQKYPDIDLAAQGVSQLDWASISALGTYVVVHGVIDGTSMTTKVFTRQGQVVSSWPESSRPTHYDLTTDAAGHEVGVGVVGGSPDSKTILLRRLDTGASVVLASSSYDAHVSTRNTARAGWAYSSINNTGSPFDREIYAVRLDGSGAVERYAHHRSTAGDYYAQPHAVPSPDGKRVLFRSDWGASGGRPVQAYVVDARPICP